MKKITLALLAASTLALACSTPAPSTTTSTTTTSTSDNAAYADVPVVVRTSFTELYPNATLVTWNRYDAAAVPIDWELVGWSTLDADDYVVTFTQDGYNYHAWYDAQGNWIGSTYNVQDVKTLPEALHTTIQSKYPGYSIDKVEREMWKDQVAYEVKLKNSSDNKIKLLVDTNGNVLKEKLK